MTSLASSPRASLWPRERLAVSGAFLANGFVLGNWTPQVPVLADRLGLSESRLGLLILAFGIGAVLAMPLVGAATARFGTRRPVVVGQVLLALAFPLLALAPSPSLAALAILFFGMSMGGMDVAMNANAVAVERRLPRAMMSSCHGFWSIGGFAGAAVGGPLIAALGSTGHMMLIGLVTLLAAIPVGRAMLEDRDAPHEAASGADTGGAARGGILSWGAVAIGICALFAMVPEGAAIDWSAIYLRQDHGTEVAYSGLAFAALSGSMALFRFLGDPIRDRLGAVHTVRISVGLGLVGLLMIALGPDLPVVLVGFAVLGVGLSNIVPVAFSAAGNLPGVKPGVGISIATTIGYSGILIAPSAIGWFAEHFGFPPVFLGLAVLLALVFPLAGLMRGADRAPAH
ncbi:MFS transporter [Aureimonas jatrophae]|uniref:Predicted arabinose efflux permease, MFS family n=1 Tax=Aureimonas jatrophae TaxID=1166073 RepID=A0A1H0HL64_9HYPH|nr:MFS transporter [Aureimonas jatrophae]MBB3950648.1 MFS family permease [Aureimonas jatrophae]SDO19902.1 Predicted arabinose efflux permease, MFS family [Aureimonas jatrophae]